MNPRAADTLANLYDAQYRRTILLLLGFLILAVLFLLTQQRILRRIKRENRSMLPGLVWLQLIPFLGQLWQFFVVIRIASSIRKEMAYRHADPLFGADALMVEQGNRRPTIAAGLIYCILTTGAVLVSFIADLLLINNQLAENGIRAQVFGVADLLMIAGAISWMIYWVLLAMWTRRLKNRLRFTT